MLGKQGFFRLFPILVLFGERKFGKVAPVGGRQLLHSAEPQDELVRRVVQKLFRVQSKKANDVDDGEQQIASDKYGPIWEEARDAVDAGNATDLQYDIYNANGAQGRGWKHQDIENVVVTNHELFIGTMCGTAESKTEKVFTGNWYSVGGWTLTLISKGDNAGWEGPLTGIETMTVEKTVADGIYNIAGVKMSKLQRGLNIVVRNGKAQKILVR